MVSRRQAGVPGCAPGAANFFKPTIVSKRYQMAENGVRSVRECCLGSGAGLWVAFVVFPDRVGLVFGELGWILGARQWCLGVR